MARNRVAAGAVILAAGRSSRFDGYPKALAEFKGRTLLQTAVDKCRLAGIRRMVVVTGHHQSAVSQAAVDLDLDVVHNPDYEKGMFSSVKAGISALDGVEAFLVWPVDSVLAHPQTLLSLITAWRKARERGHRLAALVPSFNNRTGHPPLFGGHCKESILNWTGAQGLRGWMASLLDGPSAEIFHRGETPASLSANISFVDLPDPGLIWDIDTRADLAAAHESEGRARPSLDEAWQLLLQQNLESEKIKHCRLVAIASFRLALALQKAGFEVDADLTALGGLLHDLAHGHPGHALAGKLKAQALGWPELGKIIEVHTDPTEEVLSRLTVEPDKTASQIVDVEGTMSGMPNSLAGACLAVYLADKYCRDDRPVRLKTRFDGSRRLCRRQPEALNNIDKREKTAAAIEGWFRQWLEADPWEMAFRPTADAREETLAGLSIFEEA